MMRGDAEFVEYVTTLAELDWSGMDVWLVGGATSEDKIRDIDLLITGEYAPVRIKSNILQARELGPFDPFYTLQDVGTWWQPGDEPASYMCGLPNDRGHRRAKARNGAWQDELFWTKCWLPSKKQEAEPQHYGKPIQLIQNGEQIYF